MVPENAVAQSLYDALIGNKIRGFPHHDIADACGVGFRVEKTHADGRRGFSEGQIAQFVEDDEDQALPLQSGGGERQMPDWLSRRPHLDFDVVAKAIQAVHQLALGKIGEIAMHHA